MRGVFDALHQNSSCKAFEILSLALCSVIKCLSMVISFHASLGDHVGLALRGKIVLKVI